VRLSPDITVEELMGTSYQFHYSPEALVADWERLVSLTEYKEGTQFKPGLKLCQYFYPNFFDIRDKRGFSFAQKWQDPEVMAKVLDWGRKGMSQLWLSWIRRAVYMVAGLPNSTMYRPHLAHQIIRQYGGETGVLVDPCAGWGGRMLGTVAAGWHYVGYEPNTETYKNTLRLIDFLDIGDSVTLYNEPARPIDGDILLTSPPYYTLEQYTDEDGQCYNDYASYEEWMEGWLLPLIDGCQAGVKAINVMNSGGYPIATDVLAHMGSPVGHVGQKSPLSNIRNLKNKDTTYIWKELARCRNE
jgi:hypothetical protein